MSRKSRSKAASAAGEQVLACPSCARMYSLEERFCLHCGMPLVYAGPAGAEAEVDQTQEWARKILPQYARGQLVRVAGGRHQAEAELIQNMLIEEGVPSVLRRSAGFDVPDMLAAGPRDVLVPESGREAARGVLLEADLAPSEPSPPPSSRHAAMLLLALVGGGALAALIAWVLLQLSG